ncbi:MAG: hypothetical protein WCY23_06185 [Candidatus Omnitrophota bacterium]
MPTISKQVRKSRKSKKLEYFEIKISESGIIEVGPETPAFDLLKKLKPGVKHKKYCG